MRTIDSTRRANSSGLPIRFGNRMVLTRWSWISSGMLSMSGVPIVPGAMAHTRIPSGERSRAIGSVMPRMAAFAAA